MVQTVASSAEEIKESILQRFQWDSRIDDSHIDIEVDGNKVVLKGSVPNFTARHSAETDAWIVSGVETVENRLEIRYPPRFIVPRDAEIEANIKDTLHWNSNVDSTRIKVMVLDGVVRLEGAVDSYWQKFRAQELASEVVGVIGIRNLLTVVPTMSLSDEEIGRNVTGTLQRIPGLDASAVTIKVEHGIVTLTGAVPDKLAFRDAENVALYVRGVIDVNNGLLVRHQ